METMVKFILLGTFSGILTTLSQANPFFLKGIPFLTFFSLVPLFTAWMTASSHRDTQTAGLTFSFITTLGQYFWLAFFGRFSLFTLGGTIIGYLIFFWIFSLYIWHLFQSSVPFKPLLLSMSWVFYEISKSTGFLAYPWGLMAHPLHSWKEIIQIGDSIGTFGLGFFVVLINSLITFSILGKEKSLTKGLSGFTIVAFIIFYLYGLYIFATIPEASETLPVLVIQSNEDPWSGNEKNALATSIALSKKGLEDYPETEVVVWSETILKRFYYNFFYLTVPSPENSVHKMLSSYSVQWIIGAPAFKKSIIPINKLSWFKEEIERYPLLGLNPINLNEEELNEWWNNYPYYREPYELTNSALHINPQGRIKKTYAKRKLVPFAESIPFPKLPPFSWVYSGIGISSQWAKGEEVGIFDLVTRSGKVIKLGLLICFEDAFDLLGREITQAGADLFINLTNDSWSKTKSSEWQHHIVAKFRTIENRRTMLRTTNSGVTCIIDAWGRELTTLPLFQADSLALQVPIYKEISTPFTLLGDWFVSLLALSFLGIIIVNTCYNKPTIKTSSF